jgi:5,10-methylenetetrahydromethanopterin reductase
LLGALAGVTEKVRLGTSIINIYSRSPATIAMGATTIDLLSGNRMIIGLGASSPALIENWHGLVFKKPLLRMSRYIECIRKIVTGKKVDYTSEFFQIRNFSLMYKPKREYIPIFIGAVNEGMLSLATEIADGTILYLRPIEELRKTINKIKSRLGEDNKMFNTSCVFISAISNKHPELARHRAAKTLAFYTAVGKAYNTFLSNNGYRQEVKEITYQYWTNGGDAAASSVPDHMLDAITISGNREQCIKSLEKFISTGISLAILQVNPIQKKGEPVEEIFSIF